MGLSGNLTTGEILEQIVHADHILADEYKELQSQHEDETNLPKVDLVRNVVVRSVELVCTLWDYVASALIIRFPLFKSLWVWERCVSSAIFGLPSSLCRRLLTKPLVYIE